MPTAGKGFSRAEIDTIERFVEVVLARERKIAEATGISGSIGKALFDTVRELRVQRVRMEHSDRARELNK